MKKFWKPEEIPQEWWDKAPEMHNIWRRMFPDSRKMLAEERQNEGEPPDNGGAASSTDVAPPGLSSEVLDTERVPAARPGAKNNYWEERKDQWIFWKVRPTMGRVDILEGPRGKNGPDLNDLGPRAFQFKPVNFLPHAKTGGPWSDDKFFMETIHNP